MVHALRATTPMATPACLIPAPGPRLPKTDPARQAGIPTATIAWLAAAHPKMSFPRAAHVPPATTRTAIIVSKIKPRLHRQIRQDWAAAGA